jgi:hypothetical protein
VRGLLLAMPLITYPVLAIADSDPGALPEDPEPPTSIQVSGYLETYYQVHFQNPSNRVTNLRGFDGRSRTFTISNAAVDVTGSRGAIAARVALQVGHTPATYYAAEPAVPGGGTTSASDGALWRALQAAYLTAHAPRGLVLEAGLFPSPIGIEAIPIKDNDQWSRSNLFFGLPFYHVGARASRALENGWTGTVAVYNGWNSVVDNNATPSVAVSAAYACDNTSAQLLYFGGIERTTGEPEGRAWRHLVDAVIRQEVSRTLALAAQANAGVEHHRIGTSWWVAAAGYLKLRVRPDLYAAARADAFYEESDGGARLFWPVTWVASATATLGYQPAAGVSIRIELRHDHASGPTYFGGSVAGDGITAPFVPDRRTQDTLTIGVTAWF